MSLDVGFLHPDGKLNVRFQFREDGTYEFLQPRFIKVHRSIGKYVDLYGDASFGKSNGLLMLVSAMTEAREEAERRPMEWEVHLGTQTHPVRKELYIKVRQQDILAAIDKLRALLDEAATLDKELVFRGD
jgi:hypothetical protein